MAVAAKVPVKLTMRDCFRPVSLAAGEVTGYIAHLTWLSRRYVKP